MTFEFFQWWVGNLWGTSWVAFLGTGLLYAFIGIISKMSRYLLVSLMMLYMLVFGIGFFGFTFYILVVLVAMIYFMLGVYQLFKNE